jgi:hypothetical protein
MRNLKYILLLLLFNPVFSQQVNVSFIAGNASINNQPIKTNDSVRVGYIIKLERKTFLVLQYTLEDQSNDNCENTMRMYLQGIKTYQVKKETSNNKCGHWTKGELNKINSNETFIFRKTSIFVSLEKGDGGGDPLEYWRILNNKQKNNVYKPPVVNKTKPAADHQVEDHRPAHPTKPKASEISRKNEKKLETGKKRKTEHVNKRSNNKFCINTLHRAAAKGDIELVIKCLKSGANVDSREGNEWTPLHSAARNGSFRMVKLLLRAGADINAKDVTRRTPLDQAVIGKYDQIIRYLKSKGGIRRQPPMSG